MITIAITGHTSGIGKSISNIFSSNQYTVLGFSRSNGYNIDLPHDRDRILSQAGDIDIFVNNAVSQDFKANGQLSLLTGFISCWENTDKLIINISSKLAFYPDFSEDTKEYSILKNKLNCIIHDRLYINSPKILNVIPGLVDTPMAAMISGNRLSPDVLAKLIFDLVQYKDTISVQEIIVDVPTLKETVIT